MIEAEFQLSDFAQRRRLLLDAMRPGSMAVIPGAREQRRNRDVNYPFRQNSDFYYLTGFCEPDALLALIPGREFGECILFCRERDPVLERQDGPIVGPGACCDALGMDDGFPISDVDDILPGMLEGRSQIYLSMGEHRQWDIRVLAFLKELGQQKSSDHTVTGGVVDLGHLLHEQRLIKSAREQQIMSRAAQISVTAQQLAIEHIGPEANEGDVEAELLYSFRRQGAKYEAYPTIVASGENACTFHYAANSSSLLPGDLVLIDAGCEYQYYASDVTRTYPVSGRFSQYQRQLYDIVLAANKAAIDACRLGASFIEPHQAATQVLVEGLVDLGVLHGDASDLIADESHTRFCPHHTSHWLGLDVHDVGDYRLADTWRDLLPGMVLTVEPGIYIPRDETTLDVPEEYRGIGIRIEDTVLIESESCRVLSGELVKDADEIEALMAGSPKAPLSTVKSRVVA